MDLEAAPTDALEAEVARRKAEEAAKAVPKPLPKPDFSRVLQSLNDGIQAVAKDGYADDELPQWVFEAAMEAVYGKDVWKWWNDKRR